jgi:16S rRNA processing protein RimM
MIATKQKNDITILVGVITAPVGVKGNVRIRYFSDTPQDFESFKFVFDVRTMRPFKIKVVSHKKDYFVGKIEGINSRNDVIPILNTQLFIKRSELDDTVSNEFYYTDLISLNVYDEAHSFIGIVEAVHNYGAGDILEIRLSDSNQTLMIPFAKHFVPNVNVQDGYISVIMPEEVV